jgi:hypothetical protein
MIERLNNEFTDEFSEQELATVLRFLNFILQKF